MTKKIILFLTIVLFTKIAYSQGNGEISGRIVDEKKVPVIGATVVVKEGGIQKGGTKTNVNGNFSIKPLSPGNEYEVKVTYVGYVDQIIQHVIVYNDKNTTLNFDLEVKTIEKPAVTIKAYKKKLIDAANPTGKIVTGEEIKKLPTLSTGVVVGKIGSVRQGKENDNNVNIGGGRGENTLYIIDGIPVLGTRGTNFPPGAIEQIEVMSTGISAKYGNATGGIINMTTRGISRTLMGSLQAEHSVEGYGHNFAALQLSGPFVSKKVDGGRKPLVGFSLNTSFTYDKDNNPFYYKYYRLPENKLKELQAKPIILSNTGFGNFIPAAETLRESDLERVKARPNADVMIGRLQTKFDYQPTDQIGVTAGINFNYTRSKGGGVSSTMFSPEANSISNNYTGRGFLRFTQRLGKSLLLQKDDEKKKSNIQNAFYTLQVSYQTDFSASAHPKHNKNPFDYGYIGKFTQHRIPFYTFAPDSALSPAYKGHKYLGEFLDSITFQASDLNPILANYTKQVYSVYPRLSSINTVRGIGGLVNGDGPPTVHGLFSGVGSQITGYSNGFANQFNLQLDASFDLMPNYDKQKSQKPKTIHSIEFGLFYDQKVSGGYGVNAFSLWQLMRLLANKHISNLDLQNPVYLVNGVAYTKQDLDNNVVVFSEHDSIFYNKLYVASDHSRFDKSLRQKLYGNIYNQSTIDIDNLDPKTFTLDMFSAEDLTLNGAGYVSYQGFDHLGKKYKRQPAFNDFWTKKDSRGDYLRPIGAFRPVYLAGYILDKFKYKDLLFNIGVRIDRYDANTKVLKDPYSFYATRKVSDLATGTYALAIDKNNNNAQAPDPLSAGFDKDYVVYVDNYQYTKPTIVGYRKGDTWYDPFGKEISDPTLLSSLYANGSPITPYLQNKLDSIRSPNFNPNNSFADYKPQLAVSPRITFSFPISDNALFYGNYDIVNQTPNSSLINVTPDDYFYIQERTYNANSPMGNANLKMEKLINYTMGYQQRLTKKSAITIEAYYKERKNQTQVQQYLLAFPKTYTTYGNRDFSTTKGMTVKYDLRRSGPVKLEVNYTLQFAEGSGSNTFTQSSLIQSGQPNLRTVFPLDYDSRHMLNLILDYRYDKGQGPKIAGMYLFENSGINFNFSTRSGEPYTRAAIATRVGGGDFISTPITGTVNGSRIPWTYDMSARYDKNFFLGTLGKEKDAEGKIIKQGKGFYLNAYCYVQNILNTKNYLAVRSYTGVAEDDGYLTSPQASQYLGTLQNPESYSDFYRIALLSPGYYNLPRRINFGLSLDF